MKLLFKKIEINPKTPKQLDYLNIIHSNVVTFCSGPAGCGKTFLAVAYGSYYLFNNVFKKMILIRPAIEAGERIGSLPGEIDEKMDPYVQPFYDSFGKITDLDNINRYKSNKRIEIIPIAYMRGRTFINSVILFDEAQNSTPQQMKMILSRLGKNSKIIITGDLEQSDISSENGFRDALVRLRDIKGLGMMELSEHDIQRHPIVKEILNRYDRSNTRGNP